MASEKSAAFELKGTAATLTVLRLKTTDLSQIDAQLESRVAQLPHFFNRAPVVLDLEALDERHKLDFQGLVALLRERTLVPVAVRNCDEGRLGAAIAAGLGQLKGSAPGTERSITAPKPVPQTAESTLSATPAQQPLAEIPMEQPPAVGSSLMVKNPVRSGQVVYAQQTDLILIGPVNPGAEVISDGSIHAYGALRGRALAGAHGNEQARIFCHDLDAELVSICGHYLRADELPENLRRKPAQIYLQDATIKVVAM